MVYAFKNSIIKDLNKLGIAIFLRLKVSLLAFLIPSFLQSPHKSKLSSKT